MYDDIVEAIKSINNKSIVDYFIIIIPIVVSIVAIIISINTSKKQNKIAIFEKRYECLYQMKNVIEYSDKIKEADNPNILLTSFNLYFKTELFVSCEVSDIINMKAQIDQINKDIRKAGFLFKYKFQIPPSTIGRKLNGVLCKAIDGKKDEKQILEFIELVNKFYELDFNEMIKRTKL